MPVEILFEILFNKKNSDAESFFFKNYKYNDFYFC